MSIKYEKLFLLMNKKKMIKFDLRKAGVNPKVISALSKNQNVNTSTIQKLCKLLQCQPGDIMEYIDDE